MRAGKDQIAQEQQQFFYKISRNKPSWNSPVISPANSALITKPKNTRHPSTNKRATPPTVDTNHRSPLSKLIVNKIARSGSSSLGLRQSIVLLDKSSVGKLPGLIMNEIQSSTHIASSVKTFEVSVQNASPTLSNLLRKNSSVVEEKARITLQPIRQGSGTQLVRSRSPNESQDNVKYFANKRKMSKNNLDASDSNSRVVEAQQNNSGTAAAAVVPANKGTTTKMKIVIQPRETKISKILREIKWNIDSEGGSGNESQEKEVLKTAGGNMKNSFTIRSKSSVLKSAKISGPNKVEIVENKHTNPKGTGMPKKFTSYRNVLDSQTVTFMKARAPLMQEPKDSIDLSTEITTAEVIPPFFRNMKANLSARNREVRQKFAKTINYIIRKLGLLNLTLEEIVTKKPFPSTPYEREGSRPLLDAAKIGDVSEVETLIILNPYLVYEYDLLKQTALHWAARRGYTKMMRILLEKGADPDARDVSGRTPLFLAARGSLLNSVKLLLYYGANPMIKSGAGRLAIDYATELHIKSLLTRGYKLHAFLGTYSGKRFKQTWVLMDKHEFEVRDDELE